MGDLTCDNHDIVLDLCAGEHTPQLVDRIRGLAKTALSRSEHGSSDPWPSQLDWTMSVPKKSPKSSTASDTPQITWPKWYWELAKPKKGAIPGILDLTVRNQLSPLLLKLSWRG
jgi:DNA polymerase gamma 1